MPRSSSRQGWGPSRTIDQETEFQNLFYRFSSNFNDAKSAQALFQTYNADSTRVISGERVFDAILTRFFPGQSVDPQDFWKSIALFFTVHFGDSTRTINGKNVVQSTFGAFSRNEIQANQSFLSNGHDEELILGEMLVWDCFSQGNLIPPRQSCSKILLSSDGEPPKVLVADDNAGSLVANVLRERGYQVVGVQEVKSKIPINGRHIGSWFKVPNIGEQDGFEL